MSFSCIPAAPATCFFNSSPREWKILSRAEAKQRLRLLMPGTEEYLALQDILIKSSGIATVCLSNQIYKVYTSKNGLPGGFGSSEHFSIGREAKLCGLDDTSVLDREGIVVDFGHVIALAGDFYGVIGQPISLLGGTLEEKEARFSAAFSTIERANSSQIKRLNAEIEKEYHEMRGSCAPHHCYGSRLIDANSSFKKIKGDIDELLVDNSDHFADNARETYLIGHSLACREAAEAGRNQDKNKLKRAYALEAFACHFLTDLFAAGHVRNQRGPLELFLKNQLDFSPKFSKSLAGILTGAQHEYDGEKGLEVSSPRGEVWRAYGDGFFFTPQNTQNQKHAICAVQQSVNEVFGSYKQQVEISTEMTEWIPKATSFNHLPLYEIRGEELFIFSDEGEQKIETKQDYLLKAIPLALAQLPESYVNGFIDAYLCPFSIQFPEEIANIRNVLAQVFVPRIERLTGRVWHVLGVASYAQVKVEAEQGRALVEEMMGTAKATWKQGEIILSAVLQLQKQVEGLCWHLETERIKGAISDIRSSFLRLETYSTLDAGECRTIREVLCKASFDIAEVFLNVDENAALFADRSLLAAYSEKCSPELSPEERKIETTRWFQQIIQYQVSSFRAYLNMKYLENGSPQDAFKEIKAFESRIKRQLIQNRGFIVPEIVYASDAYAVLELKKIRKRAQFLTLIEGNSFT
ncbi:MAG: hypothetical protein IT584_03225 [Chlamydiae bacterium]|nr:hypothetical protein [Chlamydiota bacterium]